MAIKVQRVDEGMLRAPTRTAQGFLRVDGYIGKPGVYTYINTAEDEKIGLGKQGTVRRELRPEEEVFRIDSLAKYEGCSITAGHPPKNTPITAENVRAFEVGTVMGPAKRDGNLVSADLLIKDAKTQKRVDSGELNQLSPGYDAELELTSGMHPQWGPYHVIQRNIEPNHLALVGKARGGSDLTLRMDGADVITRMHFDEVLTSDERAALAEFERKSGIRLDAGDEKVSAAITPQVGASTMDKDEQIRLLQSRCDEAEKASIERKDALDTAQKRADAAEATLKTREEEIASLKTKLEAGSEAVETEAVKKLQVRCDEAEQKLIAREKEIPDLVLARADVIAKAKVVMGPSFRTDGVTDREIVATVVKHLAPSENVALVKDGGPSDSYLVARMDGLIESRAATARSYTRASTVLAAEHRQDNSEDVGTKREARAKAWREQWKQPLPSSSKARERQKEA